MDAAWECECGNVEYSSLAPEECEKCFRIDSFAQLPEELIDERAKLGSEEEEFDVPKARNVKKIKVAKVKASKSKGKKKK